jgi:hypothetical protein
MHLIKPNPKEPILIPHLLHFYYFHKLLSLKIKHLLHPNHYYILSKKVLNLKYQNSKKILLQNESQIFLNPSNLLIYNIHFLFENKSPILQ